MDERKDTAFEKTYRELRRRARAELSRERWGHTWTSADLVNEALTRLLTSAVAEELRRQPDELVPMIVRTMRRSLIDYARNRQKQVRGRSSRLDFDDALVWADQDPAGFLDTLHTLDGADEVTRQIVSLRLFLGMSQDEIGLHLGIPQKTVSNHLQRIRHRLEISRTPSDCVDASAWETIGSNVMVFPPKKE